MRAHYNTAGRALLLQGIDSPESIDVSASVTDAQLEYAHEHGCMGCGRKDVPLHPWGEHVECASCLGLLPYIAVLLAASRFTPRKCPVRVIETSGVEIREQRSAS